MSEYFDRNNDPVSYEEWIRLAGNNEYCRVKKSIIDNGTTITTSWLGMPTKYGPAGPMIFCTVVQPPGESALTHEYATEEEALKHHAHLAGTYYDEQEPISRWTQIINEL